MSEALALSAETERYMLPAETDSVDRSNEIEANKPEVAAKPTALNRLANFFLKLAAKTEAADARFTDFKVETKENIESAKERARETLIHIGSVALDTIETTGNIAVGLGVMGVEGAIKGATAIKEGAIEAGETAVGYGIMGKEAVVQGAKNAYEFTTTKISDTKEGIINTAAKVKAGAIEAGQTAVGYGIMGKEAVVQGAKNAYEFTTAKISDAKEAVHNAKEATLDKVQDIKSDIAERIYNTRESFIQKGNEAKLRREERRYSRETAKAERIKLAEQQAADRAGQKAAEMFAKTERAAIAAKLKAERKQQYKELYRQTVESARSTTQSAREIGRLAIAARKADKAQLAL